MNIKRDGRRRHWRTFFTSAGEKPIRVDVQEPTRAGDRAGVFQQPFRLGYGEGCDLYLDSGPGPDVIFELARAHGPLRLSTPLQPDDLQAHVDVSIDGEPLRASAQDLKPGSRLDVLDKASGRRYRLLVEPRPLWLLRPRFLALVILVLAIAGAIYGAYVYVALRGAEEDVSAVRARIESSEVALVDAIEELRGVQTASERGIRDEFNRRLETISERARQDLSKLSEEDTQARQHLKVETRASIEALQQEISAKTVEAYQRYKALEEQRFESLAARLESVELEGERFKRILIASRAAVLFIHTRYAVEFVKSGKVKDFNTFGTGFFVAPSGLGVTAQHVLFPWRYERQFLVLSELELIRLRPDSVRWSVWTAGEHVMDPGAEPMALDWDTAYHSDSKERPVHFLYAPSIEVTDELVSSSMGIVKVAVPLPGPSDVAVFEVVAPEREFTSLPLDEGPPARTEALDDVLVIGYPFSRLQDGLAIAQGVRGFVRRIGNEVIELDTAFHPGLSGAPILDRNARIIGMASAIYESDVYGMALHARDLKTALSEGRKGRAN